MWNGQLRKVSIIIVLLISFSYVKSQNKTGFMKNTVELHFSKNNFFDNQGFNLFGQNEDYYNYGLGLTYFRGLDFKNSIYLLSELHFAQVILRGNNLDVGGISEREVYFFTIGHSYKLFEKSKFQIRTLAGLNYRIGDEQMVVGYPYDWEVRLHGIMLSDFGTSVGLKLLYELPFNLQISLETIYSRFIYRNDRGQFTSYSFDDGSSKNLMNINLKLGFGFGK